MIDQAQFEAFAALGLGFAFAGLIVSGFELVARRPLGFGLLQGDRVGALAGIPVIVFSAPFLILRNTIRGRRIERRPIPFVMLATIIAGFWSLMSGRLVLDAAHYLVGS